MYGIFTYIWLIFMVNAGKYTSPMDPKGILNSSHQKDRHAQVIQPNPIERVHTHGTSPGFRSPGNSRYIGEIIPPVSN